MEEEVLAFKLRNSIIGQLNCTHGIYSILSQILGKIAAYSKIDRIFSSIQWQQKFPKALIKGLPHTVSDHCLLLLKRRGQKNGPTRFRFEIMWLRHKSFKQNVKSWWEEDVMENWAGLNLQLKLKNLKTS